MGGCIRMRFSSWLGVTGDCRRIRFSFSIGTFGDVKAGFFFSVDNRVIAVSVLCITGTKVEMTWDKFSSRATRAAEQLHTAFVVAWLFVVGESWRIGGSFDRYNTLGRKFLSDFFICMVCELWAAHHAFL